MSDEKKNEHLAEHVHDIHLEWRDYVAITVATLQTALLPFVVFIVILVAMLYLLRH